MRVDPLPRSVHPVMRSNPSVIHSAICLVSVRVSARVIDSSDVPIVRAVGRDGTVG